MEITSEMLDVLARRIIWEANKGFIPNNRHITGNLQRTMLIKTNKSSVEVSIPAQKYDMKVWNKEKTLVPYKYGGSYAQLVDTTGGFSGTHKGYIELAIAKAIDYWLKLYGIKNIEMSVS